MAHKESKKGSIRFIRKNGRIIPIRQKGSGGAPKPPRVLGVRVSVKKFSAKDRAKSGFSTGAKVGAVIGGIGFLGSPLANFRDIASDVKSDFKGARVSKGKAFARSLRTPGKAALAAVGLAAVGALATGATLSALNTAFGTRKQTTIHIGFVKKKRRK